MTITKTLSFSLVTASLLMFTACGGSSSSNEGTTPPPSNTDSSGIVPQKINITIPDGLKTTRDTGVQKGSFQKTTDNIPSYGYEQLKSAIKEAEDTVKDVKKNMLYLGAMMPDIQKECVATAINTQCIIPAGTISLTINSSLESELNDVESEFNTTSSDEVPPVNTVLSMGKILYTHFDTTRPYQHDVVLDLQPTLSALGLQVTKQLESMKWTDDNSSVDTTSDVDDEYGTYNMHLTYNQKNDGSSSMQIVNAFKDKSSQFSGSFTLGLKDLNDVNKTVEIDSSANFLEGTESNSFSGVGKISTTGGFLISKGSYLNIKFAEKETFDKDGNLLKSKYCESPDSSGTCTISDETSWHTFDDDFGIDSSEFETESFDEGDFGENESHIFESKELKVEGGTLEDGMCEILPADFDSSNIKEGEGIEENSIGNILKFETEVNGILYDVQYLNQLDSLKIICFQTTNDENDAEFVELTGADRPILTLVSDTSTGE